MKIGKTLTSIVLATSLTLVGCSYRNYNLYNGESVCVKEMIYNNNFCSNALTVTKADGRIIKFLYDGELSNPIVKSFKITKDKKTEEYVGPKDLEEAKKQIINYSKKIDEKGLRELQ
jgi:hypothetical protein